MATDLVFGLGPITSGPIDLVFGDDGDGVVPDVAACFVAAFPGFGGQALFAVAVEAVFVASFPGFGGQVGMTYVSDTPRPLVGECRTGWQDAARAQAPLAGVWQQAQALSAGADQHWQSAQHLTSGMVNRWQDGERLATPVASGWQDAHRAHQGTEVRYQEGDRSLRLAVATGWQNGQALRAGLVQRYQEALRDRRQSIATSWQDAAHLDAQISDTAQVAVPLHKHWWVRFQEGMRPPAGVSKPTEPPKPDPCYVPPPGLAVHLLFEDQWTRSTDLLFICGRHAQPPGAVVVVPVRRTYVVINSITLHRVDTGAELHAHTFSMSLDYKSWAWNWSASLHHDAGEHLGRESNGDPAELEVVINGVPFRLRLGSKKADNRFLPQRRWAVQGSGKAGILGDSKAPILSFGNTVERTAQQLMADVLTVNGVSIGWDVDWGLTDWLVPAGAWAMQGNRMQALNDIAGAAGGYVQAHNTDAVLRVLHRYPVAPWEWAGVTPDFEIPADVAEVADVEYLDKPDYNRVFVGGMGTGVFGPMKRAGTAGELLAPAVNHALITHLDAWRQRARAELSDTGQQEEVTLRMPVLPETGIIVPGKFVRYVGPDKTVAGIVRSTAVDWARPVLRQSLGIETHA